MLARFSLRSAAASLPPLTSVRDFTYATGGPRLELDRLLAALVGAVHGACERAVDQDRPMPAIGEVGLDECKQIQRWAFVHVADLDGPASAAQEAAEQTSQEPSPKPAQKLADATTTPEQMWDRFIEHLHRAQPMGKGKSHQNFLGSVASYRKLFMEANIGPEK